ncbi:MAG: heparinase II/III family protein [Clostridia bacterium]|nr:heparinase II/III family protein [Clostridia bacterium]
MKRTMLVFALLLALALTVLLASCSFGGSEGTEAPETDGEHEHVWDEGRVTREGSCDPATKAETKGEITYTCTVCGATRTEETDGHIWNDGKVIDAATCLNTGTALFECTRCKKKEMRSIPINPAAHTYESADVHIVTPPTASADGVGERVCTLCGDAVKSTVTYADYSAKVATIKTKAASFENSAFGSGSIRSDLGGSYAATPAKPTEGQHPRVLFNGNDIAGIRTELYDARSRAAASLFRKTVAKPTDGKLPNQSQNFSDPVMNGIQALALDYVLTGNEISGYSAIYAIKNALTTINYSGMSDVTRYYGYTMYIAACVYDWCHDLLTETDKTQIVLGVQKKCCEAGMEAGFPPSGLDAVSGHGAEFGILRDYLAFAIAIYDEYPGWWDYIGGRFYADYVPVRNEFYEAGMVPQGVSLYAQTRYGADIYSAWLIKAATGTLPYDAANMKQVARTIFSHELPGTYSGKYYVGFNTGDDHVPDGSFINYTKIALISSHLFGDATMRAELEYYKTNYSTFANESVIADAGVAEYLICSSSGVKAAEDRHEGMDLILYNGGWLGQIIARNSWKNDQAAVLMKVGVRTTGNHDHCDAGQFQIFYKNILAGDTGAYTKYGEDHHYYYHQATIAHNCVLIYNPALSSSENGYYSGGQRFPKAGSVGTYSSWKNNSKYTTGAVAGVSYGYADAEKTQPTYAYIAGDLTPAYDSSTVSEVTRRMLTVFDTGHPDVPMYFFVFDSIKSQNASYKKTFLLHVPKEPTISGKTVTEVNGNGKLVLQNVIGNNVTIKGVGGAGKNYWINKNGADNYVQLNNNAGREDDYWGRVEISPATGNKIDRLLNVMFVCDADKSPNLKATAIDTDDVKGAVIGKVAAVFVTSATRRSTTLTFTAGGSGEYTYYVSGVKAGTWMLSYGGTTLKLSATEDGGFLTFRAPAGVALTLTPN